jgi:hypothetical protein
MADKAAEPPPQTSTGKPFSSRLAAKPEGGWICMAARGYHCVVLHSDRQPARFASFVARQPEITSHVTLGGELLQSAKRAACHSAVGVVHKLSRLTRH